MEKEVYARRWGHAPHLSKENKLFYKEKSNLLDEKRLALLARWLWNNEHYSNDSVSREEIFNHVKAYSDYMVEKYINREVSSEC